MDTLLYTHLKFLRLVQAKEGLILSKDNEGFWFKMKNETKMRYF